MPKKSPVDRAQDNLHYWTNKYVAMPSPFLHGKMKEADSKYMKLVEAEYKKFKTEHSTK